VRELRVRAQKAEERADRYEQERDEIRKRYDDVVATLLPLPTSKKRPGWFGRMFGGTAPR